MKMYYTYIDSPVDKILIAGDGKALKYVGFSSGKNIKTIKQDWIEDPHPLKEAVDQLREYFDGKRKNFQLALSPCGTPFQLAVLRALQKIPYGQTVSYADIAKEVGSPKAVRAVGSANGRNPLSIVIPCHRVIGKDGSLTGYGGGIERKNKLLLLEKQHV